MQRLVIAAGTSTWRRAARLQVDLPVVPVQLTSEEVELYKTRREEPISMHVLAAVCKRLRCPQFGKIRKLTSAPGTTLRGDDRIALEGPRAR